VKEAVEKSDLLDVSGELVDAVMPLGTFKVSGIGLAQSYINPDDLKYLWKNEKLTYLNVTDNKPPIYDCRIPKELQERIFVSSTTSGIDRRCLPSPQWSRRLMAVPGNKPVGALWD
jgi:hypothetical protein